MSYLVEYKDGVLTIPLATMQSYLGATGDILNNLRDSEELSSASDFKYGESEYYLPFRLLDGEFLPYVDQCIGGISPCETLKEGDYLMKTMVGTIEIEQNINPRMIPMKFYSSRQYNLNSLNGIQKRKVIKEIGNFPKLFWKNIIEGMDIKIPMSEAVYKLISVTSVKANKDLTPMRIVIPEKNIDDGVNKFKANDHTCLDGIDFSCSKSEYYLSVIYEVKEEAYLCINSIARVMSNQDNNIKGKKSVFDITVGDSSAKEVVSYLSNPSSELNYKIDDVSNVEFYIKVHLPMEFSNLLVSSLNIKDGEKHSIEITLDRGSFPATEENMMGLMQEGADEILEKYGDGSSEGKDVMSGCALYLDYVGYISME